MLSKSWTLITSSFTIWGKASASQMSAAMTYFTMLSLAPLLVIAVAIAGLVYGDKTAQQEIIDQVTLLTTDEKIADTIASLISNTSRPESGLFAGMISLLVLVFGASGVFSQLQETFNEIWDVPPDRDGIWRTVKVRLIGIAMVFIAGFLLLVTLGLSTAVGAISNLVEDWPRLRMWLEWSDRGISFLLIPVILSLLFWLIPKANIEWSDVWPAAMLTAVLLALSRYIIKFYLAYSSTSEVYGAAGSLVVLLIWIYIGGLVLFYGAAFSRAWAETFGSRRRGKA